MLASCPYNGPVSFEDASNDGQETELYADELSWLKPVETVKELPQRGVRIGAFCFVGSEGAVYKYTANGWFTTKKPKEEG